VPQPQTPDIWPDFTSPEMLMALALVGGLFILAILIELNRRRRDKNRRRIASWVATRQLLLDKSIPSECIDIFLPLLHKYTNHAPLQVLHHHRQYEEFVDHVLSNQPEELNFIELDTLGELLRLVRSSLGLDFVPTGQRIHSTRELHLGQHIALIPLTQDHSEWGQCKVSAINDAFFCVSLKGRNNPDKLTKQKRLAFSMWREDDARYTFSTTIAKTNPSAGEVVLHHTNEFDRIQSRAHFRIRFRKEILIEVLSVQDSSSFAALISSKVIRKCQGETYSLSAGGISFVIDLIVDPGNMIRIHLPLLEDTNPLSLDARVVGCSEMGTTKYLVRCAFVGISDNAQETISQFVLQRQQEQRAAEEAQRQNINPE